MTAAAQMEGRVVVCLSEISSDLRERVAEEYVRANKLCGDEAFAIQWAARFPGVGRLEVEEWKARLVLAGKRPPGKTPTFER